MKYLQLFSLEIQHGFYTDQRCRDFHIEATTETQQLLINLRCVLKPLPNGFRVLIQVSDQGAPFIALPPKSIFRFQLRLQNPDFMRFTDLAAMTSVAAPMYINKASDTTLDLVSRETFFTERLNVQQPAVKESFILSGLPLPGSQPDVFAIDGLGAGSRLLKYVEATKVIDVNSTAAKQGDLFTVSYPTAGELAQGVFVEAQITIGNATAVFSESSNAFQLKFTAKKYRWKYYVVLNKTANTSTPPSIEDKDKAIVFDAAGFTDLTQAPDSSDEIGRQLAQQYPDLQIFRLLSNTSVSCQEAVRKTIQLQINGEKVISALPSPAIQNYVIDAKSKNKEDGLFHVVKYFTQ